MRLDTRLKPIARQFWFLETGDSGFKAAGNSGLLFRGRGTLLIILVLALGRVAPGETRPGSDNAFSTAATNRSPKELTALERRVKPVLTDIDLNDPAKAARVRDILVQHLSVLNTWHQQHKAELKELWAQFSHARAEQNEIKANTVLERIEEVYAPLKPQRAAFLEQLSDVLSASQVDRVLDSLTANKVHVIFNNYGEIFHDLKEEQKAYIMRSLKAARDEAIDAGSMQEKSALFKKYRMKIDAYLSEQGYDVKQAYKDFNEKLKAQKGAKRTGTDSGPVASDDSQ